MPSAARTRLYVGVDTGCKAGGVDGEGLRGGSRKMRTSAAARPHEACAPAEGDVLFGHSGCYARVDAVSLGFLKGATLDWDESLMRSAFTISSNPNAESSCGCKASFSPKA